jgi:hypothetical protein
MLVATFVLAVFSGCAKDFEEQPGAAIDKLSFRAIPGITQSETNAIESLRKKYSYFVYGINPTINSYFAFNKEGGVFETVKAPDRELLARLRQNCEDYDMGGIDEAMAELEKADYDEGADLIPWLRGKIETSEFSEAAERLAKYEGELNEQ